MRRLHGQFSGGDEDEALNLGDLGVDLFEGGDYESGCLSGAVLGSSKDISSSESDGDGFFLDGGGLLESGFEDAHQ